MRRVPVTVTVEPVTEKDVYKVRKSWTHIDHRLKENLQPGMKLVFDKPEGVTMDQWQNVLVASIRRVYGPGRVITTRKENSVEVVLRDEVEEEL
jgi:hypothetical protein